MIKFSRSRFYENHINELMKYTSGDISVLHITSKASKAVRSLSGVDKIIIDPELNISLEELSTLDKLYDLVIVTDIFEVSTDIYHFICSIKKVLNYEGKILLTSINPKWNSIFNIVELFNLKQKSYINSYIHPKKISNIFNSLGFENIQIE